MDPSESIQQLDLAVARVTAAAAHAGARGQSALLTLDLGQRGSAQSPLPVPLETAESLVGRQVICAVGTVVQVLSVHSHAAGLVVVQPAQEVEDGSPVA